MVTARPFLCLLWQSPPARIVERHNHPFYEMIILLRGVYEYTVAGRKRSAQVGDVVFFAPGTAHSEENPPDDPPQFYHIKFYWPGAPSKLPLQVQDKANRIRTLASWLDSQWSKTSSHMAEYRSGAMAGIIAEFLRLSEQHENELAIKVRRYIFRHLSEPLSLATLASHVNLSRNYFARHYRNVTGQTPMSEVRQMRLAKAKDLLLTTNMPLKNVATHVGFSDAISLSHAMRKFENVSPSQIRGRTVRNKTESRRSLPMKSRRPKLSR